MPKHDRDDEPVTRFRFAVTGPITVSDFDKCIEQMRVNWGQVFEMRTEMYLELKKTQKDFAVFSFGAEYHTEDICVYDKDTKLKKPPETVLFAPDDGSATWDPRNYMILDFLDDKPESFMMNCVRTECNRNLKVADDVIFNSSTDPHPAAWNTAYDKCIFYQCNYTREIEQWTRVLPHAKWPKIIDHMFKCWKCHVYKMARDFDSKDFDDVLMNHVHGRVTCCTDCRIAACLTYDFEHCRTTKITI